MKTFTKCFVLLFCFICTDCLFRCDYKYNTMAEGWFKLYEIPATWMEAEQRCSLQGAVLASPTTSAIAAEMRHIMKNFFIQDTEIFTGIHATLSPGNYYTVDGIPLSEIPLVWAKNEPDNLGNKERCITLNSNGSAADRMCEEPRPYICYRSGKKEVLTNKCGTVDDEYHYNNKTKSCYKFHRVPRTFSDAHFVCSAEGGHLAIINSKEEAEVLKKLLADNPASSIPGRHYKDAAIIGFHDWGTWGNWRTIHGVKLSEAGYDTFERGQPDNYTPGENCGSIFRSGLLNDLPCGNPFPFICEKDPEYPPVCQPSTDEGIEIDKRFKNEVEDHQ
uniref:C-type lectin domain-containing protein n=1 Tax=Heliothis virescens TaxID=7102 RepID=A0A2A4J242_HELVI